MVPEFPLRPKAETHRDKDVHTLRSGPSLHEALAKGQGAGPEALSSPLLPVWAKAAQIFDEMIVKVSEKSGPLCGFPVYV